MSKSILSACLSLIVLFAAGMLLLSSPTEARVDGQEPGAAVAVAAEPVTVFVLRHAEKGKDDPRDPGLSEAGQRRSEALARLLSEAGVSHLYSSEYRRTRDTLAPLGKRVELEVEVVSARDPRAQLAKLKALAPGSVAVVAGHSNTVPTLVKALGGSVSKLTETARGPMLGENEYDRLFVVTLPVGEQAKTGVVELRYGDS